MLWKLLRHLISAGVSEYCMYPSGWLTQSRARGGLICCFVQKRLDVLLRLVMGPCTTDPHPLVIGLWKCGSLIEDQRPLGMTRDE